MRLSAGFTLVELIVTMILIGIMAFNVVPRMSLLGGFDARGFRDQTIAQLRFAQKTAIAQRRTVCVTVTGTGLTLAIDTDTPPDGSCNGTLTPPFSLVSGSGLSGSDFNFDSIGSTNGSGTLSLSITGVDPIQIDAVTGYVR